VIDVRVRDENRCHGARIKRRLLPVALAQFFQTLKQTAVDEHTRSFSFDQILRSRDRSDATPK
jgi:hypothetical protein